MSYIMASVTAKVIYVVTLNFPFKNVFKHIVSSIIIVITFNEEVGEEVQLI